MIIFATACVECNPNSERHHHHRAAFGTYLVTLRFFRCEKQIIDCDCVSLVSCLIPAAAASVRLNLPLLSGLSAVFFLSFSPSPRGEPSISIYLYNGILLGFFECFCCWFVPSHSLQIRRELVGGQMTVLCWNPHFYEFPSEYRRACALIQVGNLECARNKSVAPKMCWKKQHGISDQVQTMRIFGTCLCVFFFFFRASPVWASINCFMDYQ